MFAPADRGLVLDGDVDDQVEGVAGHPAGLVDRHLPAVGQRQLDDPLTHPGRGTGVDGAHRPATRGHRLEHRHDLPGPDLADDDPQHAHPQRHRDQVGDAHLTCRSTVRAAFAVPFAGLEAHHRPVLVATPGRQQLAALLQQHVRLVGRDLVHQRPDDSGLPGPGQPGDHDVQPGPHGRPEEVAQQRIDHLVQVGAAAGQVVEADVQRVVLTDHRVRAVADQEHRRQPAAVGQLQVERRLGGGQRPLGGPGPPGRRLEDLHQLVVAVGDRLTPVDATAVPGDAHLVAAEDVHLLDGVVDQQGLESTQPDQFGCHLVEQGPFLVGAERGAGPAYRVGVAGDHGDGEPGPLDLFGVGVELPAALPLGEPFAQLPAQLADQREVHLRSRRRGGRGWGGGRRRRGGVVPAVHRWQGRHRRGGPRRRGARVVGDRLKPHPAPPEPGPARPTGPAAAPATPGPGPPTPPPRAAAAVRRGPCHRS